MYKIDFFVVVVASKRYSTLEKQHASIILKILFIFL